MVILGCTVGNRVGANEMKLSGRDARYIAVGAASERDGSRRHVEVVMYSSLMQGSQKSMRAMPNDGILQLLAVVVATIWCADGS